MTKGRFQPMDQIKYTPTHAEGIIDHPDIEHGFVTSVKGNTVFCRYWAKGTKDKNRRLRTTANSEGTPIDMLRHWIVCERKRIWEAVEMWHIKVDTIYDGENWIYENYPDDHKGEEHA